MFPGQEGSKHSWVALPGAQDSDGDEGDAGLEAADDNDGNGDSEEPAPVGIDADSANDYELNYASDTSQSGLNTADKLDKEGAAKMPEEQELKGRVTLYWLDFGCRPSLPSEHYYQQAHFAQIEDRLGKVQCCGVGRNETNGTVCVRKQDDVCLDGGNETALFTFMEARNLCNSLHLRLCTRDELQTEDAMGCCSPECDLDQQLVWTSTRAYTTLREENKEMQEEIEKLDAENADLRDDHESQREQYRILIEHIEKWYAMHPTTSTLTTTSTTDTWSVWGAKMSREDLEELREADMKSKEVETEMGSEFTHFNDELKTIMSHMPKDAFDQATAKRVTDTSEGAEEGEQEEPEEHEEHH